MADLPVVTWQDEFLVREFTTSWQAVHRNTHSVPGLRGHRVPVTAAEVLAHPEYIRCDCVGSLLTVLDRMERGLPPADPYDTSKAPKVPPQFWCEACHGWFLIGHYVDDEDDENYGTHLTGTDYGWTGYAQACVLAVERLRALCEEYPVRPASWPAALLDVLPEPPDPVEVDHHGEVVQEEAQERGPR